MKSILTTIALVSALTNTAFANFEMLQPEISRTVAQVANVDVNIKAIKLNETGVLTIFGNDKTVKKLKLSENNREALLNLAQTLSEAEVSTEQRLQVCEMMVSPLTASNLSIINLETQSLRLVLSPSNCSFVNYVRPTDDSSLNLAKTLKSQLIVLAKQQMELM